MCKTAVTYSWKGVKWIVGGYTAFIAENVILSENRGQIIANIGEESYHMLYNTLSTVATLSIAYGYVRHGRKQGPMFSHRSPTSRGLGIIFQSVGFIGLSQLLPEVQMPVTIINGNVKAPLLSEHSQKNLAEEKYSIKFNCPMDFKAFNSPHNGIFGLERVSRHPVFWMLSFSCLGPAFGTLYISEAVMFSLPTLVALIGTEHMDYRHRRGIGGCLSKEYEELTSNIPFLALILGRQSWTNLSKEMRWSNAAIALAIAAKLALKR